MFLLVSSIFDGQESAGAQPRRPQAGRWAHCRIPGAQGSGGGLSLRVRRGAGSVTVSAACGNLVGGHTGR